MNYNTKKLLNKLSNLDSDLCTVLWDEDSNYMSWEFGAIIIQEDSSDFDQSSVELIIKKEIKRRKWNYSINYEHDTLYLEHFTSIIEIESGDNKVKIVRGFGESELEALLDAYVYALEDG